MIHPKLLQGNMTYFQLLRCSYMTDIIWLYPMLIFFTVFLSPITSDYATMGFSQT